MNNSYEEEPRRASSPGTPVRVDPPEAGPEVRQDPPEDVSEPEQATRQVTVKALRLNVREEPNGAVATVVDQGTELTVVDEQDGWLKTPLGYVLSKFVS